ncbi:hypothetical protein A1D30_15365 [Acidovorax sp. GW101-3H11]|nr:hypothetical protein A1D30_15365 [Acidovorax sp. GW101-3H11]
MGGSHGQAVKQLLDGLHRMLAVTEEVALCDAHYFWHLECLSQQRFAAEAAKSDEGNPAQSW